MGRNSEGEGGRHTWDGTVKGKGEDIHGTEQ